MGLLSKILTLIRGEPDVPIPSFGGVYHAKPKVREIPVQLLEQAAQVEPAFKDSDLELKATPVRETPLETSQYVYQSGLSSWGGVGGMTCITGLCSPIQPTSGYLTLASGELIGFDYQTRLYVDTSGVQIRESLLNSLTDQQREELARFFNPKVSRYGQNPYHNIFNNHS